VVLRMKCACHQRLERWRRELTLAAMRLLIKLSQSG
jgi:hypothetical protein